MNKVTGPVKYSQAAFFGFFIFFFLWAGAPLSYAHAPKSVELAYDAKTQTLSVTINHPTLSAGAHHIESVEIRKNGTSVGLNKYSTQPTDAVFTYTYKIKAVKGDVIEVNAVCSMWGHKVVELTVP